LGVHPGQIPHWKKEALGGYPGFSRAAEGGMAEARRGWKRNYTSRSGG